MSRDMCSVLFTGAGSEHRREGGGFLRSDIAIRLQRDSNLFPPCSLLHLPKPTDTPSTSPQDRCCLKLKKKKKKSHMNKTSQHLKTHNQRGWTRTIIFGRSVFANTTDEK